MEAALAASRGGNHHVLTDFVAKYDRKELSFFGKSLGDSAACAVAVAAVNKILREINLGWNKIGDAGAQAIGEALKVNKTVINIALVSNRIGHAGAKAIGAALQVNNTLTSLELSSNNIGLSSSSSSCSSSSFSSSS
eukprot:g17400.t1